MTIETTAEDKKLIETKTCKIKNCENRSSVIYQKKYLCEEHFRVFKPEKESRYRFPRAAALLTIKFKMNSHAKDNK